MNLTRWYRDHGRHHLPWRSVRDRWPVLVSEVMLQQTQVSRVEEVWASFVERFPSPDATAAATPGDVIRAWGNLGYPRRARWLWESAVAISANGWPDDLTDLPGVGRYTAGAVTALVDDVDAAPIDANIRRVTERTRGRPLREREAEEWSRRLGSPLRGRDRLLALMDLGALVCRPRSPRCDVCPLHPRCATRGALENESRYQQPRFEGSFRQRRGRVLAALRDGARPVAHVDGEALESLVADGLAVVNAGTARLP